MKIVVPIKRVPNPDETIRIKPDGSAIDSDQLGYVMNPFDAIAVEEALQIRDRSSASCEVTAVSLGDSSCDSELRTALAMGADRAIRVACCDSLDSLNVARLLVAVVQREKPELVLMGKQAIDDDANQAGQMLAGLLDWPQATFASHMHFFDERTLEIKRETDLGLETVVVELPAIVTTDLRLNEPRYASLPAMMKAKKRPLETIQYEELGVSIEPRVRIVRLELSSIERKCMRVGDVTELLERLRYEAKVI